MPYLGRAPTGTGSVTEIDGDLKITGQLTANDTLFKMILDGTDGSSTNAGDNFLIEDGGTDGSGTDAGDDICIEMETTSIIPGQNILGTLSSGIAAGDLTGQRGWEFVSTATASSSSSIEFTGLENGYDYQIVLTEWITSAASYVRLRLGITGPTYRESGYLSSGFTLCHNGGSSVVASNEQSTFIVGQNYNQTAAHPFSWTIDILDPVGSGKTQVRAFNGGEGAGVDREVNFGEGIYNTNESHTAVQLYPTSGTFTSGTALIYRRLRS